MIVSIAKGATLFRPGEDCGGFVLVHEGRVKVSMLAESGREIVLYRVGAGEVCLQTFGCLMNRQVYSAQGIAETDVRLEVVPAALFHVRVVEDQEFREKLFAAVAARFSDMERLIEEVALSRFDSRLARALLRLADGSDRLSATHETIALEMGSGRAAVTRGLGIFARKGLVVVARGNVQIVQPARLKRLAGAQM